MRTLLIVDDEEDLREVLFDIFQEHVATVLVAADGRQALDMLKEDYATNRQIDGVLSDINMPKMTGLEMLKELYLAQIETPAVILTGFGDREKILEALKYGAFDFQDKPFQRERLVDSVVSACDFGASIKSIEKDIDNLVKSAKIEDVSQKEKLKSQMKTLMKLKRVRKSA